MKSEQDFIPMGTLDLALADIDSDGDLDAVFANMKTASRVLFNDGNGHFQESGQIFPAGLHGIAIGDIDLDGDLDLFFVANSPDLLSSPIYLNDGHGNFHKSDVVLGDRGNDGLHVQLFDLENDGDLDAALDYSRRPSVIYLNDGMGNYTDSNIEYPTNSVFYDLNSDGFMEMISREKTTGFRVSLNDTHGNFVEYSLFPKSDAVGLSAGFGFADVDEDGDPDVIYTNGEGQVYPSGILLNDGTGKSTDSGQKLGSVNLGTVATGDLNNDGHVDIILTNWENPSQVWMNDGNGQFSDSGIRLSGEGLWGKCLIRDVDNDGDMDVFIANCHLGGNGLWYNQTNASVDAANGD